MAPTSTAGAVTAGSNVTAALSVMRLTDASSTPGSFESARCTLAWQAAHVIPPTGMVTRTVGAGARSTVATMASLACLQANAGLVPRVTDRLEDLVHGAQLRIVAKLGRADTHGLDLQAVDLAERFRHPCHAVAAGHAADSEVESLHARRLAYPPPLSQEPRRSRFRGDRGERGSVPRSPRG